MRRTLAVLLVVPLLACSGDDGGDGDAGATTTAVDAPAASSTTATAPAPADPGAPGADGDPGAPAPGDDAGVIVIGPDGFTDVTVPLALEIPFRNDDDEVHTITALDGTFDSGPIEPGRSGVLVLPTAVAFPGTYEFRCERHPEERGTLTLT